MEGRLKVLKVLKQDNFIVTVELNDKKYKRVVRTTETGHHYIFINREMYFVDGFYFHLIKE